jgi:hypothetical protein
MCVQLTAHVEGSYIRLEHSWTWIGPSGTWLLRKSGNVGAEGRHWKFFVCDFVFYIDPDVCSEITFRLWQNSSATQKGELGYLQDNDVLEVGDILSSFTPSKFTSHLNTFHATMYGSVFYFVTLTLSHTKLGLAIGCGWMINWKVLDRRRLWCDECSISPFSCRYWGKQQKSSIWITGFQARLELDTLPV